MRYERLITALLLIFPGLSWATVEVPEPSILPLLAVGGIVAIAINFMTRKK
jgi:hypothetical protein